LTSFHESRDCGAMQAPPPTKLLNKAADAQYSGN
jgi:hypothetical protein